MVANAGKGEAGDVVLDARALGRYTGEAPEPRPGLPSGHIPHSLPLPFNDLLEQPTEDKPYTHLKSPAELKKILVDAVGGDKVWDEVNQPGGRQLVLTCGSGMTAAVLWLAQQIVAEAEGRAAPLASIYDESWTGYAQREDAPIETGDPTQK
jgi:thiosulfate/3-mercaptopyruvate sulfurtransferase